METEEGILIQEFAAALAESVAESISDGTSTAIEQAIDLLGANDGLEVQLPGALSDMKLGPELIAEELISRPEVKDALVAAARLLLLRLKNG